MTACQLFSLSAFSAAIDRTHGMNDIFRRKLSARRDHRLPRRQASNLACYSPAFSQYCWSTGLVNGAIHSAPA